MNTKTRIKEDEIDLVEIIKKLWKDKVLIIGLSLLFGVLAYSIGTLIPKKFKTSVIINRPSILIFHLFDPYISNNNINIEFFHEFSQELSSVTNFSDFIKSHSQNNNFINYLKKNKISVEQYLINNNFSKKEINLRLNNQNQIVLEYEFIYPNEIEGHQILNEYVNYTAFQSYLSLIEKVINIVDLKILKHEQALKIAIIINLEETIPTSIIRGNTGSIVTEPNAIYYKGVKVLRTEIDNLKQDLNNLNNLKNNISLLSNSDFQWTPILQQAIEPTKHISPKKSIFFLVGSFLGFFISLLVIFFRSKDFK
jgi:LPS O-antigen subunit length determinant protein (WzzB/FepE family)